MKNFDKYRGCLIGGADGDALGYAVEVSLYDTAGTMENPINSSKGCGGVMRVAPIGLYFDDKRISAEEVDRIGAAALTHDHELGCFQEAVNDSMLAVKNMFAPAKYLSEFVGIMEKAVRLSQTDMNDIDAIRERGQGWAQRKLLQLLCTVR